MSIEKRDSKDFQPEWTNDNTLVIWEVDSNPKRRHGKSWARFEQYFGVETVKDYLEAGGTKGDLRWDWEHMFLSLEENDEEIDEKIDEELIAVDGEIDDELIKELKANDESAESTKSAESDESTKEITEEEILNG